MRCTTRTQHKDNQQPWHRPSHCWKSSASECFFGVNEHRGGTCCFAAFRILVLLLHRSARRLVSFALMTRVIRAGFVVAGIVHHAVAIGGFASLITPTQVGFGCSRNIFEQ